MKQALLAFPKDELAKKLGLPGEVRVVNAFVDQIRPGVVLFTIEGEREDLPLAPRDGIALQVVSMETETRFR